MQIMKSSLDGFTKKKVLFPLFELEVVLHPCLSIQLKSLQSFESCRYRHEQFAGGKVPYPRSRRNGAVPVSYLGLYFSFQILQSTSAVMFPGFSSHVQTMLMPSTLLVARRLIMSHS
jgi:hypothetical protein